MLGLLLILHQTGGGVQIAFGQPGAPYVWGFRWEQVEGTQVEDAPTVSLPSDPRTAWAVDLLGRLGNTAPTPETVAFVVAWTIAENRGDGALNRNNPLNTTQESASTTMVINSDGVRGYATYEDGMWATLQTLSYGYYTEIVAGLLTNDPERAKQGLFQSPWAASHYGYGAAWPK